VVAFVNELVNQNKALTKKVERLTFIERLAEETVAEADKQAFSIRNNAQVEATNLLQAAEIEAAQIRSHSEKVSKQLLAKSEERLKAKMKEKITEISQSSIRILEETMSLVWAEGAASETSKMPVQQNDIVLEPSEEREESLAEKNSPTYYSGKVDLEILPPFDLKQFTELNRELQCVPDLKIAQITSSVKNGCRISIILNKPIALLDMLRSLPQVREALAEKASHQIYNNTKVLINLVPRWQT
jgi:hypothetical protein